MPDLADKLMDELQQAPLVEILGIVDASGAAGGNAGKKWVMLFTLESWKNVGGPLQIRELTIRKLVREWQLNWTMKRLRAYDTVHIRARVAEQNCFGKPQGLLLKIIRKGVSDPDLQRRVQELQTPVTFRDQRLGTFTLDRRNKWYVTHVAWGSVEIRLHLNVSEDKEIIACLGVAHSIWDLQSVWDERFAAYATTKFLSLKNDNWLDEDEKALSADQFKRRMSLNSITVYPEGNFEFWYDDGDLFAGHSIRVSGSLSAGPTDAAIEG